MLKKRLIPCLVMDNGLIIQSIGFEKYLPIGRAWIAVEFVSNWDVDEIILIDITATAQKRKPDYKLISHVSEFAFVPLTIGGGIHTIEDIREVIRAGADKVSINTEALNNPVFISESSAVFGAQCIVVSMDVKKNSKNEYEVVKNSGKEFTGLNPIKWAKQVESLGAGEIFLNSVDRDGLRQGYDLELIQNVAAAVKIPVIACGGVGKMEDLVAGAVNTDASAFSAANIFQFTEHSTIIAKAHLQKAGIPIRLNTLASYKDFEFDESGRLLKRKDDQLEDLWFEKVEREQL